MNLSTATQGPQDRQIAEYSQDTWPLKPSPRCAAMTEPRSANIEWLQTIVTRTGIRTCMSQGAQLRYSTRIPRSLGTYFACTCRKGDMFSGRFPSEVRDADAQSSAEWIPSPDAADHGPLAPGRPTAGAGAGAAVVLVLSLLDGLGHFLISTRSVGAAPLSLSPHIQYHEYTKGYDLAAVPSRRAVARPGKSIVWPSSSSFPFVY
ncbi:hypothetical protein TgHK011_003808 [Trichoderma gracile]|nr:hypothetical protein TgHK011_003808 [Trichoderma gracile]